MPKILFFPYFRPKYLFMIIQYNIPFASRRKIARTYCKAIQRLKIPIGKRKMLPHLNGEIIDYKDIPVIINNYNRIDHLLKLISWLEKAQMRHIFIIDNASTYPPLLDYYKKTQYVVIRLSANIGYKALWDTSVHRWFRGLPYIYTDPDILPAEGCPHDAVRFFQETLTKYTDINKVGFALQINDIPDFYPSKADVIKWESKFWNNPVSENLYKADIDTTFALYRAYSTGQQWGKTLRTGEPYIARHLPWYENPESPSAEELYYRRTTIGSDWYTKEKHKAV